MSKFSGVLLHSADGLIICLALASWQGLTKTPLNAGTALMLVGLCCVLRLMGDWRRSRASAAVSAAPEENERRRIFVDNPEGALALARLSGFDYVKRSTPFAGKWMTFCGRFEGVAETPGRDFIHLSLLLNSGERVNLRFAPGSRQQLSGIQPGRRIAVTGQIPVFGSSFVPENCELVRIEPVAKSS